ncbi:MAG: hypothetical protein HZB61_15765 [Nitrospirae bacterium]|nr:hypothetical protein [Nitrospirota bacterium]
MTRHYTIILLAIILALPGCSLRQTTTAGKNAAFEDINSVPRVTSQELKDRLDKGEPILIADVRSVKAYDTMRVAGAVSIPFKEIESRLNDLPRDREIVFY